MLEGRLGTLRRRHISLSATQLKLPDRALLQSVRYWTVSILSSFYFRGHRMKYRFSDFDVLLTVHLSIFFSVINQLGAQNFCFTISLFHASTCFEHICSSS